MFNTPMHIDIYSTSSGKQWDGHVPTMNLEQIFRWFNRVDESDAERLSRYGYDLPSLSAGDFVGVDGVFYLCASIGWVPVTHRQASIPQFDYLNAVQLNGWENTRPPMFFRSHEDGSITYMHPAGWTKRIPANGPTERLDG